jgi:hypothetical protein
MPGKKQNQKKKNSQSKNKKKRSSNKKTRAPKGARGFNRALVSFKGATEVAQGYSKTLKSVSKDMGSRGLSMSNMLRSFVLPFDTLPLRLPSLESIPTCLVKLFTLRDLDFNSNAYDAPQTDPLVVPPHHVSKSFFGTNGTMMAFCFRDCFRSVVLYEPNKAKATNTYEMYFAAETSDDKGADPIYVASAKVALPLRLCYLSLTQINGAAPAKGLSGLHSSYFFAGRIPGQAESYFWVDATADDPAVIDVQCFLGTNTSTHLVLAQNDTQYTNSEFPINVVRTGDLAEPRQGVEIVSTFANEDGIITRAWVGDGTAAHVLRISITTRGYYALNYNGLAPTAPTDVYVGFKAIYKIPAIDVFSHLCVPGILAELPKMQSLRVNGAALMLTCQAPEIQKAGKISMIQRVPTNHWFNIASSSKDFTSVQSEQGYNARSYEWKDGGYGFVKPVKSTDFEFNRMVTVDRTASYVDDIAFDFLGMSYTAYLITAGNSGAGIGYLTAGHQIEYTSTSQWASRASPPGNHNVLANLVQQLAPIEQFHENPFHISDLLGYLKTGAAWTYKNKDKIAAILSAIKTVGSVVA